VVVGVVGNLLSFVVLVQRPMRRVSTYCYLIVLAVADTAVLTAGLLPKWIEHVRRLSNYHHHHHHHHPDSWISVRRHRSVFLSC